MTRKPSSPARSAGKTKSVTLAQVMERIDRIETLVLRLMALQQPAIGQAAPSPICPNGSCGVCGKCVPVYGCPVGNCPQFSGVSRI